MRTDASQVANENFDCAVVQEVMNKHVDQHTQQATLAPEAQLSEAELVLALQKAAARLGDYNLFLAPCTGTIQHVDLNKDGSGSIRFLQQLDENGLVSEENVCLTDETSILAGLRPIVKKGQQVNHGDLILEVDPEAISSLTEKQLSDLVAYCSFLEFENVSSVTDQPCFLSGDEIDRSVSVSNEVAFSMPA